MKKISGVCLLGLLMVLCAAPAARAWGFRTHRVFGWVAAQDTAGLPPQALTRTFMDANMLPDMLNITFMPYSHQNALGEYLLQVATNDTRRSCGYGFFAHRAEDYIGHTYYITEDGLAHGLKEIGLDGLFVRSPVADEQLAAREAAVQGDIGQLIEASTLYTQEHGGTVPSALQFGVAGLIGQLGVVGEVVLTDSPAFYNWANASYPRSEWQGWMDQSVSLARQWVNEHASGAISAETRTALEAPLPEDPLFEGDIETFLAELGMVALAENVVRLKPTGRQADGSTRFVVEIARPARARKILLEFLGRKAAGGGSLLARQLGEALQLTLRPEPLVGAQFLQALQTIRLTVR